MTQKRANVFGLGLIGGSLGLALIRRGWHVTGCDSVGDIERQALSLGIIHEIGVDRNADITFVATPVSSIAEQVVRALTETTGVVTDVGGVRPILLDRSTTLDLLVDTLWLVVSSLGWPVQMPNYLRVLFGY